MIPCAVLIAILYCMTTFNSGYAKYRMSYAKMCADNIPCKMYTNLKVINGDQFVSANFSCPILFGDNLKSVSDIGLKIGNSVKHLVRITENSICYAANNYLGPFFSDMIRAAGYYVVPACPIPARTRLFLNNYKFDFDKMKIQLPLGTVHITLRAVEKSSGKDVFCLELELVAGKS